VNFPPALKEKIFVAAAILLIGFGTVNLALSSFAQQTELLTQEESLVDRIAFIIIERLLAEVGPIVGGAVMIGIQFARKKGLVISAEAEEYFVNSAKSFVSEQSKWMYEQLRDNRKHWEGLDAGQNVHEGGLPKSIGREAKKRVTERLLVELRSDEFTKATASLLRDNLDSLVERTVTSHNKELAVRGREIIFELAPLAVEAALLPLRTKEEIREKAQSIVDVALASIKKNFDFEEIPYDNNLAEMTIKAELRKKLDSLDST
jgi:hypothetical protein